MDLIVGLGSGVLAPLLPVVPTQVDAVLHEEANARAGLLLVDDDDHFLEVDLDGTEAGEGLAALLQAVLGVLLEGLAHRRHEEAQALQGLLVSGLQQLYHALVQDPETDQG